MLCRYPAWSEADGSSGLCWDCVASAENHKSQLRQELIQEGEQLLTDLNLNSLSYLLDEKRDHQEVRNQHSPHVAVRRSALPLDNLGPAQKKPYAIPVIAHS